MLDLVALHQAKSSLTVWWMVPVGWKILKNGIPRFLPFLHWRLLLLRHCWGSSKNEGKSHFKQPLHLMKPNLWLIQHTRRFLTQEGSYLLMWAWWNSEATYFSRQYLPAKTIKWGIKEFVLVEAKTGYALKSIVYTEKPLSKKCRVWSFRTSCAWSSGGFWRQRAQGFHERLLLFSKPFLKLKDKNICACGTVNSNRKGCHRN